jgi:hypothetical protein
MNNIKIKLKTTELQREALDRMVAKCEVGDAINEIDDPHFYSADWALAGPIIEREKLCITASVEGDWTAFCVSDEMDMQWICRGPTPLIAAMRCYVASQLGDEVEVPEELKEVMA